MGLAGDPGGGRGSISDSGQSPGPLDLLNTKAPLCSVLVLFSQEELRGLMPDV